MRFEYSSIRPNNSCTGNCSITLSHVNFMTPFYTAINIGNILIKWLRYFSQSMRYFGSWLGVRPHYWPFLAESICDSPHKGSPMRESFPCNYVIMEITIVPANSSLTLINFNTVTLYRRNMSVIFVLSHSEMMPRWPSKKLGILLSCQACKTIPFCATSSVWNSVL